jgi:hypothetical protein
MSDGVNCHVRRCLCKGHHIGTFQAPFCERHFNALTTLKRARVESIRHFSVLDPQARTRAMAIVNECRAYLLNKRGRASGEKWAT